MTLSVTKRHLLIAAGIVSLAGLWWIQGLLSIRFSIGDVRAYISSFGALAPLVYVGLLALFIIIPPLPDLVLVVPAGLVFGLVAGTAYTLLGALIGATVNFWLARHFGRSWLLHRLGDARMARVDALVARTGWVALFLTRLVPGFPFQLISYAAGLIQMSLLSFVTATLCGMVVPATLTVAIGANARAQPGLAVVVIVLGLVGWAAVPVLVIWSRKLWTAQPKP